MASTEKNIKEKNTLQKVVEEQRNKAPSKYDYNKVLFEWEANDRPVYYFSGTQKVSFTSLLVFFGLYFFWVGQPILTLVAASIFFILFVFISIPPQRITHKIEKVGIRTLDKLYGWEDMIDFWLTEKDGSLILYVDTRLNFPNRLIFIIESFEESVQIVKLLSLRKPYHHLTHKQSGMQNFLEGKYIDPVIFFGEELDEAMRAQEHKKKEVPAEKTSIKTHAAPAKRRVSATKKANKKK